MLHVRCAQACARTLQLCRCSAHDQWQLSLVEVNVAAMPLTNLRFTARLQDILAQHVTHCFCCRPYEATSTCTQHVRKLFMPSYKPPVQHHHT
jgi:hypothetical protein